MNTDALPGGPVRLTGTVGTIPGLLAKNQFVLLNPDGRGLLVQGNGKQPSPPYGATVRLTGTLVSNDSGVSLRMYARDRWTAAPNEPEPQPRIADLLTPSAEDAWSLAEVTGTVSGLRGAMVDIDTEDASLTLAVRPAIKYRAARLAKGDQLRLRGLLDTRSDPPRLLPRSADEIELLAHATKPAQPTPPPDSLPPWAPFGAAGATIAASQGYKRIKKIHEQRRLERLLKDAADVLVEPTNV